MITRTIAAWAAALSMAAACVQAQAQDYPARPIKLVVPQAPGGGADVLGRLWASWATQKLGQTVYVENRPGANGVIAASYARQQKDDGYTVLFAGVSQLAFNPHIYRNLSYDVERDFDGVAMLANTPTVVISSKSSGIENFAEFVSASRAQPGQLNFASAGNGNSSHLAIAMIAKRLNLQLTHIPYNGIAAAENSILAGQTQILADVLNNALVQVKAGKVNALAVIGSRPDPDLEGIPTIAQAAGLPDFPLPGWYALLVPKGTPRAAIERLNAVTQQFFSDPESKEKLAKLKLEPWPSKPEDVLAQAERDGDIWSPLIKELGLSDELK